MNENLTQKTTILRVSDLKRSAAWYTRMLDMTEVHWDERNRAVTLTYDGTCNLTLWEVSPGQVIVPAGLDSSYVAFVSDDLLGDHELLTQRGAQVTPLQDDNGLRLFWVNDPDGNQSVVIDFRPE